MMYVKFNSFTTKDRKVWGNIISELRAFRALRGEYDFTIDPKDLDNG